MSNGGLLPHQINEHHGKIVYRCRGCGVATGLVWFMGTSCPVCLKLECVEKLEAEYAQAYQQTFEEGRP